MYRRKKYLDKIYFALEKEKLVLLLGTRQVGKTTILETLKEELSGNKYFYSFEDDFSKVEFKNKQDFVNYFSINLGINFKEEGYFFIDEFQYIKSGEQILKSIYDDKDIKLKFVVTGSGLWTYSDDSKGTLVGRGTEIFVYPFDFFEFLEIKKVNTNLLNFENLSISIISIIEPFYKEYLSFGGYPAVVNATTKKDKIIELEKIITRYLERDISFFLSGNSLLDFKKFFSYISTQIGNLVKKEAISEFLGIKLKYIDLYLNILEKTMFISRVYPYFSDKSKEYSSAPKFYFGDIGIFNFLERSFDYRENNGKIVENFIFNEILKNKEFNSDEIKVYKKITKSEIDFIYDGFSGLVPIEVKSGNKKAIPKIFFSFENDYGPKTKHYIITSNDIFKVDLLQEKKVFFLPNWLIGNFLTYILQV